MKEFPPQGAEASAEGVHYRLWSPVASNATVQIITRDGQLLRTVSLRAQGDCYFHGLDSDGRTGDRYRFSLEEAQGLPDPASRWQPEGVHGPSMVIDPSVFQWSDTQWRRPEFRDLVIYELHVGTFTPEGTFRGAIARLDHLRNLGVNAIELMPIGDFAGQRNWGYDGVYLYAPSRAYGHPDDLRALVNAAHQRGLSVILDVVYNHFGPDGNYLQNYIGEYLDEAEKTPWGGAIRYGEPHFKPLRELVVSNPLYWMREFHIDGFRLDATHAIKDTSSLHILKELTAAIHLRGGYAIAEDSRNDARMVTPQSEGGFGFDAVWADDFHHIVRVGNTHEDEGYLSDFAGTLDETIDTLQHGWRYRGQVAQSTGRPRGTLCRQIAPERFLHCISNHDQTGNHAFGERLSHRILPTALRASEVLLCLTPYLPMLFMGQEWGATTPFLFFTDHNPELGKLIVNGRRDEFRNFAAFNSPETLEKIPNPQLVRTFEDSRLVWEEVKHGRHAQQLALYRECLALRAAEDAFRPRDRGSWSARTLPIGVGALFFDAGWMVLFDLQGGHEGSLRDEPIFKSAHTWEVVLSSNAKRFGGDGTCALNLQTMHAAFDRPETIVLRAR